MSKEKKTIKLMLVDLNDKADGIIKLINKKMKHLDFLQAKIDESLFTYSTKFDSIEDTFFTLYQNIKNNQFLFAQDKDDWWNEYMDLKRRYREEQEENVS